MLLPMLSLRTPCPSCRPPSQSETLNNWTCLLLLPHFVDAMQSPCNGFHPTATCLATRLLTLWQSKALQRNKWIGPPATLMRRPPSRPSKWRHEHPRYNKADPYYLLNQTGTSDSVQAHDRSQPPQLSPVFQTPHRPYRAVPLRYWQSDNRTSTAVLPHLRAIQKGIVCLFVGCLTSQQHASVSQGRICSDNFTCCHTEIEAADQTFHLTQSQYTDTGRTSPSADPITPGGWQGSHWSANF